MRPLLKRQEPRPTKHPCPVHSPNLWRMHGCWCVFSVYLCVCVCVTGTPDSDTVCEKCPQGFFSSVASATERCVPHQDCSQLGMKTRNPGTATQDTVCDREPAIDCTRKHTDCRAGECTHVHTHTHTHIHSHSLTLTIPAAAPAKHGSFFWVCTASQRTRTNKYLLF